MGVHCSCPQTQQKRASDPIKGGCEPRCDCWELNLGPLEEQLVFLTTEPSLQSQHPIIMSLSSDTIYFTQETGYETEVGNKKGCFTNCLYFCL